jgi:flagellar basal-body rod protein FlgB
MTTQDIGLFKALGAKMDYLSQRQRVIAQNIANANTPGYKARDLSKVDFGAVLARTTGDKTVRPERTSPLHMLAAGADIEDPKTVQNKKPYEVTPTGNAVIMEEQMVASSQNMTDYNLMTNLYQKNIGLIRIALGQGQ